MAFEEQTDSGFGTTVRAFAFDGEAAKFRSWEGKTIALAGSKGFLLALTRAATGRVLTVEEFEYGELQEPGLGVTGGEPGALITRPTTKAENRKYTAKAQAWTYLVASCTDKAYALIELCDGDPFKAWKILQEKYCATDAEENYPDLDHDFNDCKLVGTKKDPELWFNDLDHLNMRLRRINLKYEKDELQMKSHMMTAMSKDYDSVIVKFRGDLNETSLAKLRKEVVLQFRTLVKAGGKTDSETVLTANVSKHPYKKFKGTCRNCGKIGHKANECRSAKVETTGGTTKSDKSKVTCFNCQQLGHYANKCTNPKKPKADTDTADMGMFVGASAVDTYGNDDFFDSFETTFDDTEDEEEQMSYEMVPFWGTIDSAGAENTTFLSTKDNPQDLECEEHVGVTTLDDDLIEEKVGVMVTRCDYVGSAVATGITEEWLLDSGATCGVTYDKSHMTDLKLSTRLITIGNGDKVATESQGTVTLTNENGQKIKLTDVYYAPSFTKHIVSMAKLIQDDWSFCVADKTEFVFSDPGIKNTVKFIQNLRDKLFYLSAVRTAEDTPNINSLTTAPVTLDINIAHGLLGHPDTRTVTAMAKKEDWTLTGSVKPCGSCALAKARAKSIAKSTMTKATVPGERLFLDISGPYSDSLNQNKYWLRIVDDYTRYSWDCFLPRKAGIDVPLLKLLVANKAAGKPCKYLRCDNAGENEAYVQQVCAENNIQLEMTAPNTPQMNGVVERSFATCKNRAMATMYCARFSLATQGMLWPEAINTVTKIGNSLPRQGLAQDPHTAWFGTDNKPNRILGHLQPFGRIAYVTDRKKLKAKLDVRATKCVFIGYAVDHSGDTYKFYNPDTQSTFLSRDVHQWMEWHGRVTATDDMDLFTELEKLKSESAVILPATSTVIPILTDADFPDDDALEDMSELVPRNSEEDITVPVDTSVAPPARRNLTSSFVEGAVTRSQTRVQQVTYADVGHRSDDILFDLSMEDITEMMAMSAALQSDPQLGVPKNYKELLKLQDKDWFKSLHGELENFLSREAWEFLMRSSLPPGRKTLRCRWIFKQKLDGTKKSCTVVRGYEQEPGVDFNESYSPLATNTTIRVVLSMSLYYAEEYDDWINIMVDVEAAFLNAEVDTDIYIEMPEGLKEYQLSKGIDLGDVVIKLRRAQYGLVQSPRLWMQKFAKILKSLGLIQCKTDPCLFLLFGDDKKLLALVVVYCDDCILTGRSKWVNQLKIGISEQVKISDLGNLKRHLGVDYEFGRDEHGQYIQTTMKDYHESMVRDFEKDMSGSIKTFSTPGAAVTPPLRSLPDDEIILIEEFRSYVGRIMFACGKTEPTLSNACRELTVHLTAPNKEHWTALTHLMGYIKTGTNQGTKLRTPRDTRVVAFVDSDYASDRGDRKSISGYLVTVGGCLVSWQSKKQTGVTLSSTEAEFVAMSMVATEVKFVVSILSEMGNGPPDNDDRSGNGPTGNSIPVLPSILKEDNTGAIFMANNTAIGQRTKHVDIRYRFVNDMILSKDLLVEHIRSGDNPSDAMTKNLPLNLFAKHATLISDGLLGKLYDPQNTEDVKIYCATVLDNATVASTTVSSSPVLDTDSTVAICSGDHTGDADDGWTEVPTKTMRPRDPAVEAWIPQDSEKIRVRQRIHGIRSLTQLSHVLYGSETAPVGFDRKVIPSRKRRAWKPNQ